MAVIVGASLSGLMTALALSRAGVNVSRLERSGDSDRTGAAIHVGDGLLESITGLDHSRAPRLDGTAPLGTVATGYAQVRT